MHTLIYQIYQILCESKDDGNDGYDDNDDADDDYKDVGANVAYGDEAKKNDDGKGGGTLFVFTRCRMKVDQISFCANFFCFERT